MTSIETNHELSGDGGGAGVIDADLPCCGCGYNLRSIHSDNDCPECGTPAFHSLQDDRLVFSHPNRLRRMVTGTNWILVSIGSTFLFMNLLWIPINLIHIPNLVFGIANQLNGIMMVVGAFLATPFAYGRTMKQNALRHLARWLLLSACVWIALMYVFVSGMSAITIPLYAFGNTIHVLGSIALFLYLGSLADGAGKTGMMLHARILSLGYAVSLFSSLLISSIRVFLVFGTTNSQSTAFHLVSYMLTIYLIFLTGLYVWELIFFFMFRRMLVAILKLLRTNTQLKPRRGSPTINIA